MYRGIAFEMLKFIVKAPYELARNAVLSFLAWAEHPISNDGELTVISFPKSERARAYKSKIRRILTPRSGLEKKIEAFICSVDRARNCIQDLSRDHEEDEISTQARLYLNSRLGAWRYTSTPPALSKMRPEARRQILWTAVSEFNQINKRFPRLVEGNPSDIILMYADVYESPFDSELKLKAEITQDPKLLELLSLVEDR